MVFRIETYIIVCLRWVEILRRIATVDTVGSTLTYLVDELASLNEVGVCGGISACCCLNESLCLQQKDVGIADEDEVERTASPWETCKSIFRSLPCLLVAVFAIDIVCTSPTLGIGMSAPRIADATSCKVETRVERAIVVLCYVYIIE